MLTDVLTNTTVKAAIEALQRATGKPGRRFSSPMQSFTTTAALVRCKNSPTTRWAMSASPQSSASKIMGSMSSAHSIRTGGVTSEPISGFNCRRPGRSNVLISGRPSSAAGGRISRSRSWKSYSGVAARNPANTMAAITVSQTNSVGMTEIIAELTRRE